MRDETRRHFMAAAAGTGVLFLLSSGCGGGTPPKAASTTAGAKEAKEEEHDEDVAPPEDLMREHGVLNRLLLVYDEGARRLESQHSLPIEAIAESADIIRRFIEQYHEKLEEDFVFPRFEKANKLVELTATLRRQHQAGRNLTESILRLAKRGASASNGQKLAVTLRLFARMYRPHEAREDTVLFPAFRTVVTPQEFAALGEQFEEKEHELFGKEGFEGIVAQVAKLEQALGIHDLAQFTPETT